jgi:hypothetical protein
VSADPYRALVALAEREYALVVGGETDGLAELAAERAALVAALPAQAPQAAVPALERAAGLQLATTAALRVALDRTRGELGAAPARRQAARAYAGTALA